MSFDDGQSSDQLEVYLRDRTSSWTVSINKKGRFITDLNASADCECDVARERHVLQVLGHVEGSPSRSLLIRFFFFSYQLG